MIAPGSKGWIAKYFQLVTAGEIILDAKKPSDLSSAQFKHHFLASSGIVFGYPSRLLFGLHLDRTKWTQDEQLTVLLFEALVFTHRNFARNQTWNEAQFLEDVELFYKKHRVQSMGSLIGYLFKEGRAEKMERILSKRCDIHRQLGSTKSWVGYFDNAFIYLDVLLFEAFLRNEKKHSFDYQSLALIALAIIAMSAYSDGQIEESEKALFETFLISADLDGDERELARLRFKQGISLNELEAEMIDLWNFKRYLLDLSALTIFANHEAIAEEKTFLDELRIWLNLEPVDLDESIMVAQQFVLENNHRVSYLKDDSAVEAMMTNVSKRWIKVLGRNKDKLATELKQSKELVALIRKSTSEELSKEEKEKVKTQFMDIVKSMPALAIFLLPGGALLLPIVLKIIPDLVPSAFRDNEIDDAKK